MYSPLENFTTHTAILCKVLKLPKGSQSILQKNWTEDLAKKATNLDEKQYYEGACKLYENSIDHFLLALKSEPQNEDSRSINKAKCRKYLNRAEELKILIMEKKANLKKVHPNMKIDTKFESKQYKVEADSVSDEIIEVRSSETIKPTVTGKITKFKK